MDASSLQTGNFERKTSILNLYHLPISMICETFCGVDYQTAKFYLEKHDFNPGNSEVLKLDESFILRACGSRD